VPFLAGSNESCVFDAPSPGVWYIVVYAFFSYTGVTLNVTVN
jgi:hypothetical protein